MTNKDFEDAIGKTKPESEGEPIVEHYVDGHLVKPKTFFQEYAEYRMESRVRVDDDDDEMGLGQGMWRSAPSSTMQKLLKTPILLTLVTL